MSLHAEQQFLSGLNGNVFHCNSLRLDLPEIARSANKIEDGYLCQYQNLTLNSAYQPIYSIDHQKIIGYEALVRARDHRDHNVFPDALFLRPKSEAESIFLDRLCRFLHVANFQYAMSGQNHWLFINVSSLACEKGRNFGTFFAELLDYFNFDAKNIVIEITEDPSTNNDKLLETVNYYKSMGCLIAIDDFGAGNSNFERIWNLKPDIVKVDRQMVVRAVASQNTRNMLNSVVTLLHQAGCLVVLEGIEDKQQALIAINSGADFVQGFYFSKPQPLSYQHNDHKALFVELSEQYLSSERNKLAQELLWANQYRTLFAQAVDKLKSKYSFTEATLGFKHESDISRCYLVDDSGRQLGSTIAFNPVQGKNLENFQQLQVSQNANWYRKAYVRNAIKNPNRICITEPYQSITGEGMCVTLSMFFQTLDGGRILCADIKPAR